MRRLAAVILLFGSPAAFAEPDLSVKSIPLTHLRMPRAAAGGSPGRATVKKALPTSTRDWEERVIVRLNVGFALDGGTTSGDPQRTGVRPDDVLDPNGFAFNPARPYLLGDATLGTDGVLLPSLRTYFLSRFAFQTENTSLYNSLNQIADQNDGQRLAVYSGYAELDSLGDKGTPLGNLSIRAGRQFRYGASRFVANFDGITASYRSDALSASTYFGRRASAFFSGDPGYLGGASARIKGREWVGLPFEARLDYLVSLGAGSSDIDGDGVGDVSLTRHYLEASTRLYLGATRLLLRGRFVDNGDFTSHGAGLGHLALQIRQPLGRSFLVVATAQHRQAREVAYDFISPTRQDVVDVSRQLGIGLDPPETSNRLGLRLNWQATRSVETFAFGRVNLVSNDNLSGFQQSWYEAGAALSVRLPKGLTLTPQAKTRITDLAEAGNGVGSFFFDTSGSGARSFFELAIDARYRPPGKKYQANAGAYFRTYTFRSPYADVDGDGRGGGRVDGRYQIHKRAHLRLAGEIAQPSRSFARELGLLYSARAICEVMF